MDLRRPLIDIVWAVVIVLGRGLIGALAGLIVGGLALTIAFAVLRLDGDSRVGLQRFYTALGVVVTAFVLVAIVWGGTQIRGRKGATIKGMLAGAACGVVIGFLLGNLARPGVYGKSAIALGIFVLGPLGAIAVGYVTYQCQPPPKKCVTDDPSSDFR